MTEAEVESVFSGALAKLEDAKCATCGCTDAEPCCNGCCWVTPELCSCCAPDEEE